MAETAPQKPVVIILDMAKGYGWAPGSYGYDMVARVRRLKDAARAVGVQVIHVHSMRRPTDNLGEAVRMQPGSTLAHAKCLWPYLQDGTGIPSGYSQPLPKIWSA